MFCELHQVLIETFIGAERMEMRNALRYWTVDGGPVTGGKIQRFEHDLLIAFAIGLTVATAFMSFVV